MTAHEPAPPSPPAVRLRRPGWRDPRLLVGVMLVAASVALGSALVSGAARTVPVWAANEPLVPGDPVDVGVLSVREVRLGAAGGAYLPADEALPEGLVAVRTVDAGELLPASAVAPAGDLGLRPVAITPDGALPGGLREGARVDLWFVPEPRAREVLSGAVARGTGGEDDTTGGGPPDTTTAPRELARGLVVAEVSAPRDGFSVSSSATVHVLVPRDQLPEVLAAQAADGSVQVVLVPGS